MKNTYSLKKFKEFNRVREKGKSFANREILINICENGKDYNNLGIIVTKKIGNSVIRHRIKRLIKEAYRLNENNFKVGYDIVFVAKKGSLNKNYFQIEKSINHLKHKINI